MYEITFKCGSAEEATDLIIAHQVAIAQRKEKQGGHQHHTPHHPVDNTLQTAHVGGIAAGFPNGSGQPGNGQYQPYTGHQPLHLHQPAPAPQPQQGYQPQQPQQGGGEFDTWQKVLAFQAGLVSAGKLNPAQVYPVLARHGASVTNVPSPDKFLPIVNELKQLAGVQ